MFNSKGYSLPKKTSLYKVKVGSTCTIEKIHINGLLRRRIMDLGIIPGTLVSCVRRGPTGDPSAYKVRGTTIALRKEDAEKIDVYPL
ncbi:MAG: FeoA family protein [Desulfitobacteriia bacterium]|jgi:ferrous iron transport protein A